MAYCDDFVLLHHGRVVASGDPVAVLTPRRLADVFGVRAGVTANPLTGRPHLVFATTAPLADRKVDRDDPHRPLPPLRKQ